jgi:hypothetical protein
MRLSATILIVACCSASLVGCCNRFHRHSCLFGNRHKHNDCVDQQEWDDDDGDSDNCPCDGGMMYGNSMPMQSFDSGCGCGCDGGMPQYMDAGMPMSYPSYQPSGCGCGSGDGGMMMGAPMPTYSNQSMMMQPMPESSPVPTPAAAPPAAPPASSVPPAAEFYSPRTITPTSSVPAAF